MPSVGLIATALPRLGRELTGESCRSIRGVQHCFRTHRQQGTMSQKGTSALSVAWSVGPPVTALPWLGREVGGKSREHSIAAVPPTDKRSRRVTADIRELSHRCRAARTVCRAMCRRWAWLALQPTQGATSVDQQGWARVSHGWCCCQRVASSHLSAEQGLCLTGLLLLAPEKYKEKEPQKRLRIHKIWGIRHS